MHVAALIIHSFKTLYIMLLYNLIQRANPRDLTLPKRWYATPATRGRKTIKEISADVSGSSSLSRGDIQNVILSLVDQVPKYLLDGQSVELGELGSMRISFSSEGVENKADFNAAKIDDVKIIFTPSPKLKTILVESHFEAVS